MEKSSNLNGKIFLLKSDFNVVDLIHGKYKNTAGEEVMLNDSHIAQYVSTMNNHQKKKMRLKK